MRLVLSNSALGMLTIVAISAQVASPQRPIFRAGVEYVRVDVVVTGQNEKPITDLTKDDFEIIDHGRAQAIDACQLVSVPVEHQPINTRGAMTEPDVVTNTPPTPQSRVFVLVIDDLHIMPADLMSVKRIMTEFLAVMSPDDEVGVVFVQHSNLGQNITRNRDALLKTADNLRLALGFGLDALGHPNASQLVEPDSKMVVAYARESDSVLKSVAQALAGSGHVRRAIVYVSAGSVVPTVPKSANPTFTDFEWLHDAYEAARRADVPIYTIDPRGQPLPEDAVYGGIGSIGGYGALAGEAMRARIAANIVGQEDRLAEVAVNTGGRAFTRQSDLQRAVDEIVGDNGSLYVLGYYPIPFEADGKFHPISIHVKRAGVRVRARVGYVASSPAPASLDLTATLNAALGAGVNVSAIPLKAVVSPIAPGPKGMSTLVAAQVSYPPTDGSKHLADTLLVRIVALDADGHIKASVGRELQFAGTARDQAPITFLVDNAIDLPPGRLTIRVGVASRLLGSAGMVQLPVTIPKSSDSTLQLSGIVLGFAGPPREAAVREDAAKALVPFQSTTSRVFSAQDALRIYNRVFWRGSESHVDVTLTMGGIQPPETRTLAGSRNPSGLWEATVDATQRLDGFSTRTYELTIEARLPNGQAVRRTASLEVR